MVSVSYYNLSGGINQSRTKTELGLNTKKLFWTDAQNIEIYKNRGLIRQKGNSLFLELPENEKITGLAQMGSETFSKLVITTISGQIFVYDKSKLNLTKLDKTLSGTKPRFEKFLNGLLLMSESDGLHFIKNNETFDIVDCNLTDNENNPITNGQIAVFAGRVWVGINSTVYYSALGTYNDFQAENDAGYISDFHTNTDNITALKPYKNYLAIYKKQAVYLLSGTTQDNFAITPFCNIGANSASSVLNVANRQYFVNSAIYALEETGELNQIHLGEQISENIKDEFIKFDSNRLDEIFALYYENKNQIWYYFPYQANEFFKTIWINDCTNKAWYKRVLPQDVTIATIFDNEIYFGTNSGKIYKENVGETFNGKIIEFIWKSPFLSIINPHHKKIIDEFYFVIDDEKDNKFKFSVYKDFVGEVCEDCEEIYSIQPDYLIWYKEDSVDRISSFWPSEEENAPLWSINRETLEKAEISGSNYSIQLCIEGYDKNSNCAIIGLEFREIYNDD